MPSPVRFGLVAALAITCHGASAQTVVPPQGTPLIGLGISNPAPAR